MAFKLFLKLARYSLSFLLITKMQISMKTTKPEERGFFEPVPDYLGMDVLSPGAGADLSHVGIHLD